jgi:hypothetical protein
MADTFHVQVKKATFIPDESAVREFVAQLNAILKDDQALLSQFESDPRKVLSDRGVARDIQTELLVNSGVAGAEDEGCTADTCLVFTTCSSSGGGSATIVITHFEEETPIA